MTNPPTHHFLEEGEGPVLSVSHLMLESPLVKKLQMRTELIDQLKKWHSLLQDGGITQVQYNKLQGKIMKDMGGV